MHHSHLIGEASCTKTSCMAYTLRNLVEIGPMNPDTDADVLDAATDADVEGRFVGEKLIGKHPFPGRKNCKKMMLKDLCDGGGTISLGLKSAAQSSVRGKGVGDARACLLCVRAHVCMDDRARCLCGRRHA